MAIFMQIPNMNGNVTAKNHSNKVEVKRVNMDIVRKLTSSAGNAANREGSRPIFSPVSVVIEVDAIAPNLFTQVTTGQALSSDVVIQFTQTNDGLTPYLELDLTQVMVSRWALGPAIDANGNIDLSARPELTLDLSPTKVQVKVTPNSADHSQGSPNIAGYDIAQAAAA
jgi:type VI secretion system secreted protein Hcp